MKSENIDHHLFISLSMRNTVELQIFVVGASVLSGNQRAESKPQELNESCLLTLETLARYYRVVIELIAGPVEPGLQLEIHRAPDTNKLLGSYLTTFILSA